MVSHKWRNDPEVWKLTGNRPDRIITPEIENKWIKKVIADKTCQRFAISLKENDEYIGNVQITDITKTKAEFHIFIGERKYWGLGIGYAATREMINYVKREMQLKQLYLYVNPENIAAIRIYEKLGFNFVNKDKMLLEL